MVKGYLSWSYNCQPNQPIIYPRGLGWSQSQPSTSSETIEEAVETPIRSRSPPRVAWRVALLEFYSKLGWSEIESDQERSYSIRVSEPSNCSSFASEGIDLSRGPASLSFIISNREEPTQRKDKVHKVAERVLARRYACRPPKEAKRSRPFKYIPKTRDRR